MKKKKKNPICSQLLLAGALDHVFIQKHVGHPQEDWRLGQVLPNLLTR